MNVPVYTIGHSNHPFGKFVELLRGHGISAVADVRSSPYSRFNPQYNRETMKAQLAEAGIVYVFLGRELGARAEDPRFYERGQVQFRKLAEAPHFRDGLARVLKGTETYRLTLLCAEKEPLECHRTLLVARELAALGVSVVHIHADGALESWDEAMDRLVRIVGLPESDLYSTRDEIVARACELQEQRVAFVNEELQRESTRRS